MKNANFKKLSFLKTTAALATAALCTLPILAQQAFALSPLAPLTIQEGKLRDSYGKPFIFRGVTIDHTLAPEKTLQALKDISAAGANAAQIEFPLRPDAFPRTVAVQLREIIAACKEYKLVCVLEANDSAGHLNYSGYSGFDVTAFWLMNDITSILEGNQDHIIIGFGNQHFSTEEYPGDYQTQVTVYVGYLLDHLPAGYLVMIDGNNWAEDTAKTMLNLAQQLKDPTNSLANRLIYSVDMFYSYQDPNKVRDYIAGFNAIGAPLVIGGFAQTPYYHPNRPTPLNLDAPQLPAESVMQYAQQYGAGYFGWSWSGNKNSNLDLVTNYDASALTNWGNLLFNNVNGIKATAKRASIYDNISSSSSSSSSSVPSNRPPIAKFDFISYYYGCTGPNAGLGSVSASATGSSDPDGDTLTYYWEISGGRSGSATGPTISFTTASGASYKLTLIVTDTHGASATSITDIPVFNSDCPRSSSSSLSSSMSSRSWDSYPSSSAKSSSIRSSSSSSSSRTPSSSSVKSASSSSISNNGKAQCSYQIQNQWGNGFTAAIRLKNVGTQPISGWNVSWKYADTSKVTNFWNANLSGANPYTATNLNWNSTIQPGQTIEFGFQGSKPAGTAIAPAMTGSICQ